MHSRFRASTQPRSTAFRDAVVPPSIPSQPPVEPALRWPKVLLAASLAWIVLGLLWQRSDVAQRVAEEVLVTPAAVPAEREIEARQILESLFEGREDPANSLSQLLSSLNRQALPYNVPLLTDELATVSTDQEPWSLYATADLNGDGRIALAAEQSQSFVRLELRYAGVSCHDVILALP